VDWNNAPRAQPGPDAPEVLRSIILNYYSFDNPSFNPNMNLDALIAELTRCHGYSD
jgi:hypothetical protein